MATPLPTDRQLNNALIDSLLETKVTDVIPGHGAAIKPFNMVYNEIASHGNLSSYSMDSIFNSCARKYAIKKMQAEAGTADKLNSPTFAFGHAVGAGVAEFDIAQDLRAAIWKAFLAWDIDLLTEEENRQGKKTGKSFYEACWALYTYRTFWEEETDLKDYEVVKIEGTLAVDFEDGHYYVGHIDELLRNKYTGSYRVKENKTTGLTTIDPCMYSNSDQALSYAVVIDMLGGAEYDVLYTIYSSKEQRWVQFSFVKTPLAKAEWVQDQLLMHQHKDDYTAANFWPKRGASCFSFMRRCEFYQTCDITMSTVFGKTYADLKKVTSIDDIQAIEFVDYPTTLTAIVNRQKEKLNDHS